MGKKGNRAVSKHEAAIALLLSFSSSFSSCFFFRPPSNLAGCALRDGEHKAALEFDAKVHEEHAARARCGRRGRRGGRAGRAAALDLHRQALYDVVARIAKHAARRVERALRLAHAGLGDQVHRVVGVALWIHLEPVLAVA